MTLKAKEIMDEYDEVLDRIRMLERSVEAARFASLQRWRFVVLVFLHGAFASTLTFISTVYPNKLLIAFVNAWILGCFLWSLLWFSASPRALYDRAARLFLSALAIVVMLREATELCFGMFPDVAIDAAFVSPFVLLTSRWTVAFGRTSVNAPDILERRMHPLSIIDFFIASTLMAVIGSVLSTQEQGSVYRPLFIIGLAFISTFILALMLVFLARARNWFMRIAIVGLAAFAMAMVTTTVWSLLGSVIENLSFVEIDERNSFAETSSPLDYLRIVMFAVVVVMPSILTLGMLHYHGYRMVCESRRTA